MSWLTGESSQQVIQVPVMVISIVGMGGLGKTTLAQLICKDDTITSTFQLNMWVSVSEPFDLQRVIKEITKRAGGIASNDLSLDESLHRLCASIRGKRFLLVLDNVWSEDPNELTPLKLSLDAGAPGSRIIVTTRNMGVANMMGSEHTYSLGQLPEDDSFSLFWKIASSGRSQEELDKFKQVGIEIAKKCKGVPLAIKTIASLVKLKRSTEDWRNVLESEIWDLKVVKSILPALLFSYYDLSPSLKQCFAFCAIYPKDTELKRDELVQLWMAQGYLGLDEEKELEIIGVEHFEDLVMRSLFQDVEKYRNVEWKMHDLVHDLAQFLTESECTILERNDTPSGISNIRHINTNELHLENPSILKSRNLRSLFIKSEIKLESHMLRDHLRYLRVLSLYKSSFKNLPDEVGGLSHLRYIDLSGNRFLKKLPETVCNLLNLQTLKLEGCINLCELPEEIGKLSKLRHLEIEKTKKLNYLPQSIGKLRCLRSLGKFIVGPTGIGCGIGELRDLSCLRGTLRIEGLEQVGGVDEAKRAELLNKRNLNRLDLKFGVTSEEDMKRVEGTLEGLQPHIGLEELNINGYGGRTFSFWMSLLPKLKELYMKNLRNWEGEIEETNGAASTRASIMPGLRELFINNCPKLKVVPNYLFSPSLRKLYLWNCPQLTGTQPCLPPLLEQLYLRGDVGVLSVSLLPIIAHHNNTTLSYPQLKSVVIFYSPHSSLPQGLSEFTSLQKLGIWNCDYLDLKPEENLRHFPMLQLLKILNCPLIEERCGRENWRTILCHQIPYKIDIRD